MPPGADADPASGEVGGRRAERLRKRRDFLAAGRSRRVSGGAFSLHARCRGADEPETGMRVGFTCSKRVGNAVERNRAKRRLREAARTALSSNGREGWDYVLIGRARTTASCPFQQMTRDIAAALDKVHRVKELT